MKPKWRVEHVDFWNDGRGGRMETVKVYDDNRLDPWGKPMPQASVWWDAAHGKAYCERCHGSLSAMLQTCPHARAVKRIRLREAATV